MRSDTQFIAWLQVMEEWADAQSSKFATITLKDLMARTKFGKSTAMDAAIDFAEMVAREQARLRAARFKPRA